ncbi:DeoR/GlpR family DNA-binding transcription regulator [Fervidobacterium thailandense]|uniref:HTH deoR-type domain-containing protein n=1 Tax=Fervidobacterium thailandense TaxID=1008305 RepID=A0A1E3G154_9BACT|nr:DeoR/GlpR family DNA-binding transcription regulator [Fervidobacterium thailandense]ODN29952.1 hypothetical protein A4H02_08075 [Fervidobacterium thailandense]
MLREERLQKILTILKERRYESVRNLAKVLNVPEITVRRDLEYLEKLRKIKRIRGGATVEGEFLLEEHPFERKIVENIEAKKKIAQEAFKLIERHDVIFLDAGTTTYEIAELIFTLFDAPLTVFTNSLQVICKLHSKENIELFVIGNKLRHITGAFIFKNYDLNFLEGFHIFKAFIAANGFDDRFIYTPSDDEAFLKRRMIEISEVPILVADSSKAGKTATWKIAPITSFKYAIFDSLNQYVKEFQKSGVTVIVHDQQST